MEHEKLTKKRDSAKAAFNRIAENLQTLLNAEEIDEDGVTAHFTVLLDKYATLKELDGSIMELEFSLEMTADTSELEQDKYFITVETYRSKVNKLINKSRTSSNGSSSEKSRSKSVLNLPKIQLKNYGGELKGWIQFWSYFEKIHSDQSVDPITKFHYLYQSTSPNSKARQIIDSFPASKDNYVKVIKLFKERFGQEDLLVEVYVRELLSLVIKNDASASLSYLYDQLQSQLRALETLGVTTEVCSAMLLPLVESCLPEELLRAWQRHSNFSCDDKDDSTIRVTSKLRLERLMKFLSREVESEERISLALAGFGLNESKQCDNVIKSSSTGLVSIHADPSLGKRADNVCVFCGRWHSSNDCYKAQKMSYETKVQLAKDKGLCIYCLYKRHGGKGRCSYRGTCVVCTRRHLVIMCPRLTPHLVSPDRAKSIKPDELPCKNLASTKGHGNFKSKSDVNYSSKGNFNKPILKDSSCYSGPNSNFNPSNVLLQTLVVYVKGSRHSKKIRALIDTGSSRSYILEKTAEHVGYIPLHREVINHGLFGGTSTGDTVHKSPIEVRLVGVSRSSRPEGRLEVRRFGVWGTVCDDDFGSPEAQVVCNALGHKGPAKAYKNAKFGPGSGVIWMDSVHCDGNETGVERCLHEGWGQTNCKHDEDVSVVCALEGLPESAGSSSAHANDDDDDLLPEDCGTISPNLQSSSTSRFKPRVVSGFETAKGTYPWQASVRLKSAGGKSSHWCGAVVVGKRYALTAGHCLRDYIKSHYFIRAGDYDTQTNEGTEQDLEIEEMWVHEELDRGARLNNDVALVRVKPPGFVFNTWVQPTCMPQTPLSNDYNCTISGWGTSAPGSGFARTLHAAWLSPLSRDDCSSDQVYGRDALSKGMFCAGSLTSGPDSCQGDSGGPFVCLIKGKYMLHGITSWGHGCGRANSPGVYTDIWHYKTWLTDTLARSII